MSYFLDVLDSELEDANDIMRSQTDVVPYDSYPHPDDSNYHRMQFESEDERGEVASLLRSYGIDSFKWDGNLTSSGLFI
jgi:hypothetical protein